MQILIRVMRQILSGCDSKSTVAAVKYRVNGLKESFLLRFLSPCLMCMCVSVCRSETFKRINFLSLAVASRISTCVSGQLN